MSKSFKDIISPKSEGGKLVRDIVVIILIVALIGLVLFAVSGTWPALVAVESGSMEPNIPTYSLAFVVDENRYGGWQTQEEALRSGSGPVFNGYGDVLVYKPNGMGGVTPIIHRALRTVTDEEAAAAGFNGDHGGVITKGDNNKNVDQYGTFSRYGAVEPVKEEWIVGKALFAIPLIGWVPLNIVWSILIAIAIIAIVEIISRIVVKNRKRKNAGRAEKREMERKQQKKNNNKK